MKLTSLLVTAGILGIVQSGCKASDSPKEPEQTAASLSISAPISASETFPSTETPKAVGERIFQQYCQACHGIRGAGGMGPSLVESKNRGMVYLTGVITQGRPGKGMPSFRDSLSPSEIASVASYITTFNSPSQSSLPPAKRQDR